MTSTAAGTPASDADRPRRLVPVSEAESMRLLAGVPFGRVVFTQQALPAIRPVNHLVRGGLIIIRTSSESALGVAARSADGTVVAYEADDLNPATRTGWSVVATGLARAVAERSRIEEYESLLRSWIEQASNTFVAIDPQIVTGFHLA